MRNFALVGAVLAIAVAAFTGATASAAPATGGLTVPATCTQPGTTTVTGCTVTLVGFTGQNGTLQAILQVTNTLTGEAQRIVADLTAVTQQQAGSCTLLDLTIRPIDLDLLGLHLHTDTIHIVLTAQRGTLLGNLLCGLFFGNPTGAATTLNQLLRQGLLTL